MSDNKPNIAIPKTNEESTSPVKEMMRKCVKCGAILPISNFTKYGKRHKTCCKTCEGVEVSNNPLFEGIDSRELIIELRARGYKGTLTKTVTKEIVI